MCITNNLSLLFILYYTQLLSGFKESDGTEAILHQLELLEREDIGIDKNQLKMSACQALSKLAAKSGWFPILHFLLPVQIYIKLNYHKDEK